MKAVKSFANGRLADAELARKAFFGKARLFIQIFAKNVILNACIGKRGQVLRCFKLLDGFHHAF